MTKEPLKLVSCLFPRRKMLYVVKGRKGWEGFLVTQEEFLPTHEMEGLLDRKEERQEGHCQSQRGNIRKKT